MKTRSLLLCGALAIASGLSGCGAIEISKRMVNKFTGADDSSNTGALARAGRMQNNNTDTLAGAVGVKTEAAAPAPEALVAPPPVAAPEPAAAPVAATVAPAPEPAASAAKKPVAKKAARPMVKSVSTAPPKK